MLDLFRSETKDGCSKAVFFRYGRYVRPIKSLTNSKFIPFSHPKLEQLKNTFVTEDKYKPASLDVHHQIKGLNKYGVQSKYFSYEEFLIDLKNSEEVEEPLTELDQRITHEFELLAPDLFAYFKVLTPEETFDLLERDLNGEPRSDTSCGIDLPTRRKLISDHKPEIMTYLNSVYNSHSYYNFDILVKLFPKDEMRLDTKDTRSISVPQIHGWLTGMMLFGSLYHYFKRNKEHSSAFGIDDSIPAWTRLFRRFERLMETTSLDIAGQDRMMSIAFISWISSHLKKALPTRYWPDADWWFDNIFYHKLFVDIFGNVFKFSDGHCSGEPLTIIINIIHVMWMQACARGVDGLRNKHDCNSPVVILGDDNINQFHCKTLFSTFERVAGMMGHKITGDVTPTLDGAIFLSQRISVSPTGDIVPYYANLPKALAALTYYNGKVSDYIAKLSSFKQLLRYSPEDTEHYKFLLIVDSIQRDLVRRCSSQNLVPYVPLSDLRRDVSFRSLFTEVGWFEKEMSKQARSRQTKLTKQVKREKQELQQLAALNTKLNRLEKELKHERSSKSKKVSKSKQNSVRTRPNRSALPNTARKGNAPNGEASAKRMAENGVLTMLLPDKSTRLPTDEPGSMTCLWGGKQAQYDFQYQSSNVGEYFAIMIYPSYKSMFSILDAESPSLTMNNLKSETQNTAGWAESGGPGSHRYTLDTAWAGDENYTIQPTTLTGQGGLYEGITYSNATYYSGAFTYAGTSISFAFYNGGMIPVTVSIGYLIVNPDDSVTSSVFDAAPGFFTANTGYTQKIYNAGTFTAFQAALVGAKGVGFWFNFPAPAEQIAHYSLELIPTNMTREAEYAWQHIPYGYTLGDGDVAFSQGQKSLDLHQYLNAYPLLRLNAHNVLVHSTNKGMGANTAQKVSRRIPRAEQTKFVTNNPETLWTVISQLAAASQISSDPAKGDEYLYLRDDEAQWKFIPTDTSVFTHIDTPFLTNRFYPTYITVYKKPISVASTGDNIILPLSLMFRVQAMWEFQGLSSLGKLEYPPVGQAQYRTIYAKAVQMYLMAGIGENPKHLQKAVAIAKQLAADPAVQMLAKTIWSIGKVAIPVAISFI